MLEKIILAAAAVMSAGLLPSFAQFITDQEFVERQLTCKDVRQAAD